MGDGSSRREGAVSAAPGGHPRFSQLVKRELVTGRGGPLLSVLVPVAMGAGSIVVQTLLAAGAEIVWGGSGGRSLSSWIDFASIAKENLYWQLPVASVIVVLTYSVNLRRFGTRLARLEKLVGTTFRHSYATIARVLDELGRKSEQSTIAPPERSTNQADKRLPLPLGYAAFLLEGQTPPEFDGEAQYLEDILDHRYDAVLAVNTVDPVAWLHPVFLYYVTCFSWRAFEEAIDPQLQGVASQESDHPPATAAPTGAALHFGTRRVTDPSDAKAEHIAQLESDLMSLAKTGGASFVALRIFVIDETLVDCYEEQLAAILATHELLGCRCIFMYADGVLERLPSVAIDGKGGDALALELSRLLRQTRTNGETPGEASESDLSLTAWPKRMIRSWRAKGGRPSRRDDDFRDGEVNTGDIRQSLPDVLVLRDATARPHCKVWWWQYHSEPATTSDEQGLSCMLVRALLQIYLDDLKSGACRVAWRPTLGRLLGKFRAVLGIGVATT
jgi:hypothetical protein